MITEFRIHARGGQRATALAELIATVALAEGKSGQAYESFGLTRPGSPTYAIARVADEPIRERGTNSSFPDHVIVLDPSVLPLVDVTRGLKPGGMIFVAGTIPAGALGCLGLGGPFRVLPIAASPKEGHQLELAVLAAVRALI